MGGRGTGAVALAVAAGGGALAARSPQDLSGTSADPWFQRAGLTGGGFGGGAGTDWGRMLLGTDVLLSFGGQGDAETPSAGVGRWRIRGRATGSRSRGRVRPAPSGRRSAGARVPGTRTDTNSRSGCTTLVSDRNTSQGRSFPNAWSRMNRPSSWPQAELDFLVPQIRGGNHDRITVEQLVALVRRCGEVVLAGELDDGLRGGHVGGSPVAPTRDGPSRRAQRQSWWPRRWFSGCPDGRERPTIARPDAPVRARDRRSCRSRRERGLGGQMPEVAPKRASIRRSMLTSASTAATTSLSYTVGGAAIDVDTAEPTRRPS